jgi:hypothetical protein
MISVLATEPKVHGFKPSFGDGLPRTLKIRSKPSVKSYNMVPFWHVKELYEYETNISQTKSIISFTQSNFIPFCILKSLISKTHFNVSLLSMPVFELFPDRDHPITLPQEEIHAIRPAHLRTMFQYAKNVTMFQYVLLHHTQQRIRHLFYVLMVYLMTLSVTLSIQCKMTA